MYAKAAGLLMASLLATGQSPNEQSVERVLSSTHAGTAQEFQELVTAVRAISGTQQASIDEARRTVALRGTAAQAAAAEWLFNELDGQGARTKRGYSMGDDDLVRVFYLARAEKAKDLQEIATVVRSTAGIPRLFIYSAPRAMAMRGTAAQMAMAEWLVGELDQPAGGQSREYRVPGATDDVLRVFFVPDATDEELQKIATQTRSATRIPRLFVYNAPKAMAVRGTAGQIAQAERLIKEQAR